MHQPLKEPLLFPPHLKEKPRYLLFVHLKKLFEAPFEKLVAVKVRLQPIRLRSGFQSVYSKVFSLFNKEGRLIDSFHRSE